MRTVTGPQAPSPKSLVRPLMITLAAAVSLLGATTAVAPAAQAQSSMPVIDDSLFSSAEENPTVTVTREDGTPVTANTPVHRGDVLLVHGAGFSAQANRGGMPVPIFPGVPNGIYALYSGFGDYWKPSEGAPGETRTHPHDYVAWVLPDSSLNTLPDFPVDMRTTIAREAQTMNPDGSFTARVVVDPPANTPGQNFGVYIYPAQSSINPAEELYVPIPFDPAPGPNTVTASPDLTLDSTILQHVAEAAGGSLTPRDGAQVLEGSRISYTSEGTGPDGVQRFHGTVHVLSRYMIVDTVIKDPWVERCPNGTRVLTAEVSNAYNASDDQVHRQVLGTLSGQGNDTQLMLGPVALGDVHIAG